MPQRLGTWVAAALHVPVTSHARGQSCGDDVTYPLGLGQGQVGWQDTEEGTCQGWDLGQEVTRCQAGLALVQGEAGLRCCLHWSRSYHCWLTPKYTFTVMAARSPPSELIVTLRLKPPLSTGLDVWAQHLLLPSSGHWD